MAIIGFEQMIRGQQYHGNETKQLNLDTAEQKKATPSFFSPKQISKSILSNSDLEQLVCHFYGDLFPSNGQTKAYLLCCGVNDTYKICHQGKEYTYRIYTHKWKSEANVQAEMTVLSDLRKRAYSPHYPLLNLQNEWVTRIDAPEGVRYGVLFPYVKGSNIRLFSPKMSARMGEELAELHISLDRCKNEELDIPVLDAETLLHKPYKQLTDLLDRLGFGKISGEIKEQDSKSESRINPLVYRLAQCLKKLKGLPLLKIEGTPAYGICHGDAHINNIIGQDEDFVFIDYDLVSRGPRAYDIATFLWRLETRPEYQTNLAQLRASFLKGYEKVRALSQEEKANVPTLMAIRQFLWLGAQAQLLPNLIGSLIFEEIYFNIHLGWLERWCDKGCREFAASLLAPQTPSSAIAIQTGLIELQQRWWQKTEALLLDHLKREHQLGRWERAKNALVRYASFSHTVGEMNTHFQVLLQQPSLLMQLQTQEIDSSLATSQRYEI